MDFFLLHLILLKLYFIYFFLFSFFFRDASVVRNVAAFCKLCGTETFGLLQLRNHLYSEQHAENEKLLHRQLH